MNRTRIIRGTVLVAGIYFVVVFLLKEVSSTLDAKVFERITPVYTDIVRVIGIFGVGVGVANIFMVHVHRIIRVRQHWEYSIVLIVSFLTIFAFGILKWLGPTRVGADPARLFNYVVTEILIHMNSTIYSFLAFFVASAALRAFRVRGLESAIMMVAAVVVLLAMTPETARIPYISEAREWIDEAITASVFRALQFGMILGGITVALRTWLGIERSALFEVT